MRGRSHDKTHSGQHKLNYYKSKVAGIPCFFSSCESVWWLRFSCLSNGAKGGENQSLCGTAGNFSCGSSRMRWNEVQLQIRLEPFRLVDLTACFSQKNLETGKLLHSVELWRAGAVAVVTLVVEVYSDDTYLTQNKPCLPSGLAQTTPRPHAWANISAFFSKIFSPGHPRGLKTDTRLHYLWLG